MPGISIRREPTAHRRRLVCRAPRGRGGGGRHRPAAPAQHAAAGGAGGQGGAALVELGVIGCAPLVGSWQSELSSLATQPQPNPFALPCCHRWRGRGGRASLSSSPACPPAPPAATSPTAHSSRHAHLSSCFCQPTPPASHLASSHCPGLIGCFRESFLCWLPACRETRPSWVPWRQRCCCRA